MASILSVWRVFCSKVDGVPRAGVALAVDKAHACELAGVPEDWVVDLCEALDFDHSAPPQMLWGSEEDQLWPNVYDTVSETGLVWRKGQRDG